MKKRIGDNAFSVRKNNEEGKLLFDETFFLNIGSSGRSIVPMCHCVGHAFWNHGYTNAFGVGILPGDCRLGFELVVDGEVNFYCLGTQWHLQTGDIMILLEERPVKIQAVQGVVEKYNLLINGHPSLMNHLTSVFRQMAPVVRKEKLGVVQPLFIGLYKIFAEAENAEQMDEKCVEYVSRILYKIYSSGREQAYPEELSRGIMYIETSLKGGLDRRIIADHCGVSVRTLNRLFEKYLHTSPAQYCIRVRVETAKNLLTYFPEMPVKNIAHQAGFSSSAFFCKTFRRLTGVSPNGYRKRQQKTDHQLSL